MALGEYMGPLPVWGWIALGGGGLFLYHKYAGSSSASGGLLGGLIGNNATAGAGTSGTDTSASTYSGGATSAPSQDETNSDWGQDAIQYLMGEGYTQAQAQSAIGTYTSGGTLDPTMATLVDNAVQGIGQPPQLLLNTTSQPQMPSPVGGGVASGTSAGSGTTTGVPQSGQTATVGNRSSFTNLGATRAQGGPNYNGHQAYYKYTVKKGDTISSVAKKFGSGPTQLEQWNKTKSIKPGQTIWV